MASYPSSVKTFSTPSSTTQMDDSGFEGDVVISDIHDEVEAIETELGAAPKTITQATTPAATPASVAEFLDMVATQLKAITGGANWYTSVGTSLATDVAALATHIADTTTHGTTGAIVGETDTQTLTNKTLTSPVLTTPQINDTSSDHQYIFAGSELAADRTVTLPLLTAGDTFVFAAFIQTLTNKRITKRTGTTTSSATPTINTDNYDFYSLTAQTEAITSFTSNLSGTPTEGQTLWIAITGTASRAITWGASFEASGNVALPTTTSSTTRLDVGFVWNTVTSKWRCVAVA